VLSDHSHLLIEQHPSTTSLDDLVKAVRAGVRALVFSLTSMMRISTLFLLLLAVNSCGHAPFTWHQVKQAAVKSAKDPIVWAPAAAALAFSFDDHDENFVESVSEDNPIFDSQEDARDVSDDLESLAPLFWLGTTLGTPTGTDGKYDKRLKLKELRLGAGGVIATSAVTDFFKHTADRERPDELNDESFPSRHASSVAVYSTLTMRYVDYYNLPKWGRKLSNGALIAIPYITGYARVEANRHFPSDVLAGIALGNFFGMLVNNLLDSDGQEEINVYLAPTEDGAIFKFNVKF
jgi:hypothetical protein